MNSLRNTIFSLFIFSTFCTPCFAYRTLLLTEDYTYEVYEPGDEIPKALLEEGLQMSFDAYRFPSLHAGIPLNVLQIDESIFHSYEDFLYAAGLRLIATYQDPNGPRLHYFQVRSSLDDTIVAICAVQEKTLPNSYYISQVAIHKDFRRKGIAQTLLKEVLASFPDFVEFSLDTRVFNQPAQALYEKIGFKKLEIHPNPRQQSTYYHYVLHQFQTENI